MRVVDRHLIGHLMGCNDMTYAFSPSSETAGGIIYCWDAFLFMKESWSCFNRYITIKGHWKSSLGPLRESVSMLRTTWLKGVFGLIQSFLLSKNGTVTITLFSGTSILFFTVLKDRVLTVSI